MNLMPRRIEKEERGVFEMEPRIGHLVDSLLQRRPGAT
jgi:hypothetical protein